MPTFTPQSVITNGGGRGDPTSSDPGVGFELAGDVRSSQTRNDNLTGQLAFISYQFNSEAINDSASAGTLTFRCRFNDVSAGGSSANNYLTLQIVDQT